MPPRHRGPSGYRGVRLRPNNTYYAEIRTAERRTRIVLGTYETAHEAALAYDAAAWRLGRPRSQMNFRGVRNAQQAAELAPPPVLNTQHERERFREVNARLLIAEREEATMAEYRRSNPDDVAAEEAFWAQRRAERVARREDKRRRRRVAEEYYDNPDAQQQWDDDDPRHLDLFTSSDYTTTEEE